MLEFDVSMAPVVAGHYGPDITASLAADLDSGGYVLSVTKRVLLPELQLDQPDPDVLWGIISKAIDQAIRTEAA